jgi:hypothetical protein
MQPNPLRLTDFHQSFGEVNENNELHGRGIRIWNDGTIHIGYFEDGYDSTDNYIWIDSSGGFAVGYVYYKDGG